MSADIRGSFVENFCTRQLSPGQLNAFDVDECRVKLLSRLINSFSPSIISQSQEGQNTVKFQRLWKLKVENWESLSRDQQKMCDLNLKTLSRELFYEREPRFAKDLELQSEKTARSDHFLSDLKGMEFQGVNIDERDFLMALLEDGEVIITRSGKIIPVNERGNDDAFLIIDYRPKRDKPLTALISGNSNWRLSNSKTSEAESRNIGSQRRSEPLQRGEANKFSCSGEFVFSIFLPEQEQPPSAGPSLPKKVTNLSQKEFFRDLPQLQRKAYETLGIVSKEQTCFDVLGISPQASQDEITKAYRGLARVHHPDRNPSSTELSKEVFSILGSAKDHAESHVRNPKIPPTTIPNLFRPAN